VHGHKGQGHHKGSSRMVAAYGSVPLCVPVKSLNIVDERVPGSYVSVRCQKVLVSYHFNPSAYSRVVCMSSSRRCARSLSKHLLYSDLMN